MRTVRIVVTWIQSVPTQRARTCARALRVTPGMASAVQVIYAPALHLKNDRHKQRRWRYLKFNNMTVLPRIKRRSSYSYAIICYRVLPMSLERF